MKAEQIMTAPALSRYIGSDLEPAARLIADALSADDAERNRREGLPQLAGMLAADIDALRFVPAIMITLEAAWLSGYRAGVVDGMIELAVGEVQS